MWRWRVVVLVLLAGAPQLAWADARVRSSERVFAKAMLASSSPASVVGDSVKASPPMPGDSSIEARLKACLLPGDVQCVIGQWMVLKTAETVPDWLRRLQWAFDVSNRQAGQCVKVAKAVHEGLLKLGERPVFLRVTLEGEQRKMLGFDEIVKGVFVKTHQVATTGLHVAIKIQGRIIDAYTGLAGLPEEEYMKRLIPYPGMKLVVETVDSL
ncbi:hypothetical protein HUW62_08065 [Myxococcus sp. AM011]|uniref:hypothetical protein n=1 Tax=Myxococcus sp. AM011 TaxID=2745200 RepID=UPI00159558E0|nr:hypothetical protein [Myxococcus sp. AM011]NVJ21169.1 hypothetical protein [Myxococcus sp. AM011]